MDIETAYALNKLNADFYRQQAESFSSTRHSSWAGWEKALKLAGITSMPRFVVDIACGNQRFEDFLLSTFTDAPLNALCIDNCAGLNDLSRVSRQSNIDFKEMDIVSELLRGNSFHVPPNDLTACFGFMHHIPGFEARKLLLDELYAALNPGGVLIVSFWQFMTVESIAQQAQALTEDCQLDLDENDYLLGWQNSPTARRYCHNFDEEQILELSPTPDAVSFEADGRNGRLNRYLIARKPLA